MSFWDKVPVAPPDPIFALMAKCKADADPDKIDLGVGAYRDDNGKPYLLNVVSKVESDMAQAHLDKEYLPIEGLPAFREASCKLLYGENSKALADGRVSSIQTLSGTGAVRMAVEFYSRFMPKSTVCMVSEPTWVNHKNIFAACGFANVQSYRYFDKTTKGVDFVGLTEDLENAPDQSIILLQLCAHNPTGADPSKEEWATLAEQLKRKGHVILFDSAYQGYATGDVDNDAYPARLYEQLGLEFCVCQSYAKNFGLYGERIGCLSFMCATAEVAKAITSQLKALVRAMYSNPPVHGARIVSRVLTEPALRQEWMDELKKMSGRISLMRQATVDGLVAKGTPGDWSHVTKQIGMFSFTGLTPEQCDLMVDKHHVYMTRNGRISVAGLSTKTVPKFVDAIHDVVTSCPAV